MITYYTRTFCGMGFVLAVLAGAAVLANSAASDAHVRFVRLLQRDKFDRESRAREHGRVEALHRAMQPVIGFASAWQPFLQLSEKEAAERIRSEIEVIAQRHLGLVTDNAITPQTDTFPFQATRIRIQRVSLRASGKDLVALITWLGKVEEKYPAALIEHCEFSANVGSNTGLTIKLAQPLREQPSRRNPAPPNVSDFTLSPEAITTLSWGRYQPLRVKGAVAVGLPRNPLQPAVLMEKRSVASVGDAEDAVSTRIENALDGHLRSVVRGVAPMVVVDGRVFRVGDELVIGLTRDRPVSQAKTKLKEIGEDRLVFHVVGSAADRAMECDVTYPLPALMKAR